MTDRAIGILIHGDRRVDKMQEAAFRALRRSDPRPVLLMDTEHGGVYSLDRAEMCHKGLRSDRIVWDLFERNEMVRRNWYRRNGLWDQYVPPVVSGPPVYAFGLWDQAEARHKNQTIKRRKVTNV